MILVDFSHLSSRMINVSVQEAKKSGFVDHYTEDGKIDVSCYKNFYLHLLFSNLGSIKKDFSKTYGEEIILCLDGKNYWRKEMFPSYKSGRSKSREKITYDYKQYIELMNDTLQVIDEYFPFKLVKQERAEGDDVMAIIAKNTPSEKVLIVTEDKDMKQLLKYPNVDMYRPILKQFVNITKEELVAWKATHIVGGDAGDDVPTIKTDTMFTENFIKYLKQNEVYETDVHNFNKLSISKKLYESFDVMNKKGKKDIFKDALFGVVGVEKFCKDLRNNLKEKPIYWHNYKRNKKLVMFEFIPAEIQELIMKSYEEAQYHYNPIKISSYFDAHNLRKLKEDVQMFYAEKNKITATKGMFDFWS